MTNRHLRYSLSLDQSDFEDAERLVKAVVLTSKPMTLFSYPKVVTEDRTMLADVDQDFIAKWNPEKDGHLDGLCCWGSRGKSFNIWLAPDMDPLSDLYRVSLLHELVHGYANEAKHGVRFRDLLGRAVYHYCDIISPITDPGFVVASMNYLYTRQKRDETQDDFMQRIMLDKEKIRDSAEIEQGAVSDLYERIA